MSNGESLISPASIAQRADVLEKAEQEAAKVPEQKKEEKVSEVLEKKDAIVPEQKDTDKKIEEKKSEVKVEKKEPNDPTELRKWNTRVSQENKKLRDEMAAIRAEQEKTYKLLAKMSKTPMDYKELSKKSPEELAQIIENEKESATAELQERLDTLSSEAKAKDTTLERMRREQDTENYPEWKRLYPSIVKIAMGPTGQGDPRIDFTKPAAEVLDALYELALQENPVVAPTAPVVPAEKVYKESEMKAMMAEMIAKEKDAIAKAAREEAMKEAQAALSEEAKGGTVASAGKGAGRIPSDHLSAFKKMSLNEQRDWLIAQQNS